MIESTVGNAVHMQTLYLCAGSLVILGRYALSLVAVVFSLPKIITLISFCDTIISNNGSGCQIVVIITSF